MSRKACKRKHQPEITPELAEIVAQIYHNDLIMRTVIENVTDSKSRQSLELSSRRLYQLSITTYVKLEHDLVVDVELDFQPTKVYQELYKVSVKKREAANQKKISHPFYEKKGFDLKSLMTTVEKYYVRKIRQVRCFRISVSKNLIGIIHTMFPHINEIIGHGLTREAASYLDSLPDFEDLRRRITKLSFLSYKPDSRVLVHITCYCSNRWRFDVFLDVLIAEFKNIEILSFIDLREDSFDSVIPETISNIANITSEFRLEETNLPNLSPVIEKLTPLLRKMTVVELSLEDASENGIINFFNAFKYSGLKELKLNNLVYNDKLLLSFKDVFSTMSELTSLSIQNFTREEQQSNQVNILSICCPSLKKLEMISTFITSSNLELTCNDLEFFSINSTIEPELFLEFCVKLSKLKTAYFESHALLLEEAKMQLLAVFESVQFLSKNRSEPRSDHACAQSQWLLKRHKSKVLSEFDVSSIIKRADHCDCLCSSK